MNKKLANEILETGIECNLTKEQMLKLVVEYVENFSCDLELEDGIVLTVSQKSQLIGNTRNALLTMLSK